MTLTNPTDAQLNAAFAEKVIGFSFPAAPSDGSCDEWRGENYCGSTDAVLPWLEKSPFDITIFYSQTCCHWTVRLQGRFTSNREYVGECDIEDSGRVARAAVIALLRAHGVDMQFA